MNEEKIEYPLSIRAVENASLKQLKEWYKKLPRAQTEHEQKIMQKITDILVVNDCI